MELTELCQELRNWFDKERYIGDFEISGGEISFSNLQEGQYFRIVGSLFNDGVYKYPATNLKDEKFHGAIWAMAVPPAVITLLQDINTWEGQYGEVINSPYSSESFAGYSYSKRSGLASGTDSSDSVNYKSVFNDRLKHWRKI